MKDIIRAIEIEQEYIGYRIQGEQPYALIDKISECGFDNLDEYFDAKTEHLVDSLDFEMVNCASDEGAWLTINAVQRGKPFIAFCVTTDDGVYHGDESLNAEYCEEHNVRVIEYHSSGGNIVFTSGDVEIGLSIPVKDITSEYILEHLANILSKYESDVCVDRNDILVCGKKVAGSANYQSDSCIGFVINFSFSDKIDLITAICGDSNPAKKPGHLEHITTDQLRQEVVAWLQKR